MSKLALLRADEWAGWSIVLLIDEAQQIDPLRPHSSGSTLSAIHQGLVNLPVIFCAFGLPETIQALRKVGVSRPSSKRKFKLTGLDDNETQMAVNRAFCQFDLRQSGQLKEQIAEQSNGWPQHLVVYVDAALSAAKSQIERHGFADASTMDVQAVLQAGAQDRKAYYQDRIDAMKRTDLTFEGHAKLLAQHLLGTNGAIGTDDAIRLLTKGRDISIGEAKLFLLEAQHCGLLAVDGDGNLISPIPSFLAHLAGPAQQRPPAEEPKGLTR